MSAGDGEGGVAEMAGGRPSAGKLAQVPSAEVPPPERTGPLAARGFVEIRFGGSGGQGVILMGVILAMAATRDHRYVVQTQAYGPEARGGYSRSDVIISDHPIDFPELEKVDLLVVLSQEAADEYAPLLRPNGILIYDSEYVPEPPRVLSTSFAVPFTRLAVEETGRLQPANILTLGAVAGMTGVVSVESLRSSVMGMVPRRTQEANNKALLRGLALDSAEWRRTVKPATRERPSSEPGGQW